MTRFEFLRASVALLAVSAIPALAILAAGGAW